MDEQNIDQKLTQRYNLDNFEADFKLFLTAVKKLKPITVKNYLSDFRYFAQWMDVHEVEFNIQTQCEGEADFIGQFTPQIIAAYKSYLEGEELPRRSINRRLSTVRSFFSFARAQGWITANPARGIHNVKKSHSKRNRSAQSQSSDPLILEYIADLKSSSEVHNDIHAIKTDIEEFFSIINFAHN